MQRARHEHRDRRRSRVLDLLVMPLCVSVVLNGCKELTGSQPLPAGTVNPTFYSTPAGAVGLRTQALYALEQALPSYLTNSGLLTDELESNTTGLDVRVALSAPLSESDAVNARLLFEKRYGEDGTNATDTDVDYMRLQAVRGDMTQALGALAAYDTGAKAVGNPRHLRAELFALRGYTEILLSDLFCSGIPLSTLDFNGDYTYHASSTTTQVYQDALVEEDSALALADTSTQIQYLARLLKGRALLALNDAATAAQVVAPVPDDFQYQIAVDFSRHNSHAPIANELNDRVGNGGGTVADSEGGNGLPYLSGGDPRIAVVITYPVGQAYISGGFMNVMPLTFPAKYSYTGFSPFVVADGIEARLIRAEAALRAGDAAMMVNILNQLRTTAQVQGQTSQPPATLTDPGTDSARVTLLFQERAYWLFLTGHRQGDLRRLLRQYPQWFPSQNQVYPTGAYHGAGTQAYGSDVTAPIPGNEDLNPLFHGCLDRNP